MGKLRFTTPASRFAQALGAFCTESPDPDMCWRWLETEDDQLQEWVIDHLRFEWMQGIEAIDAARAVSDTPVEGDPTHLSRTEEQLLRRLKCGPLEIEPHPDGGWRFMVFEKGLSTNPISGLLENGYCGNDNGRLFILDEAAAAL